jgi:UDP-N-acetylmuramoylalanine--D-glutamate ligase
MAGRTVILGAGISGLGAAILAQKLNHDVFVSDMGQIGTEIKQELTAYGIPFEEGKHTEAEIVNSDRIILSPGIPLRADMVQKAMCAGIPVESEIEFASRETDAHLIGVTGTNGKTTTTHLIHHILKRGGLDVAMAGNVGTSFARLVAEKPAKYYVLELSSFQLQTTCTARFRQAVLLNITPDHLDRHGTMEHYAQAKMQIALSQESSDSFIYCADDKIIQEYLSQKPGLGKNIPFGFNGPYPEGAWANDTEFQVQLNQPKSIFFMNLSDLTISGRHNAYNSMAAAVVASSLHIRNDVIRESLMDFSNVEHRLEHVLTVKGIDYINDSKATNVNAAWYALESTPKDTIWIAGGVDKGNDYAMLEKLVAEKVKVLICMGKKNIALHEAFTKHVDLVVNVSSAEEAVQMAYRLGNPGDTVLLSPACASFDLFENYEDRGRKFKAAVRQL